MRNRRQKWRWGDKERRRQRGTEGGQEREREIGGKGEKGWKKEKWVEREEVRMGKEKRKG